MPPFRGAPFRARRRVVKQSAANQPRLNPAVADPALPDRLLQRMRLPIAAMRRITCATVGADTHTCKSASIFAPSWTMKENTCKYTGISRPIASSKSFSVKHLHICRYFFHLDRYSKNKCTFAGVLTGDLISTSVEQRTFFATPYQANLTINLQCSHLITRLTLRMITIII